jgi:hypothetical protein
MAGRNVLDTGRERRHPTQPDPAAALVPPPPPFDLMEVFRRHKADRLRPCTVSIREPSIHAVSHHAAFELRASNGQFIPSDMVTAVKDSIEVTLHETSRPSGVTDNLTFTINNVSGTHWSVAVTLNDSFQWPNQIES